MELTEEELSGGPLPSGARKKAIPLASSISSTSPIPLSVSFVSSHTHLSSTSIVASKVPPCRSYKEILLANVEVQVCPPPTIIPHPWETFDLLGVSLAEEVMVAEVRELVFLGFDALGDGPYEEMQELLERLDVLADRVVADAGVSGVAPDHVTIDIMGGSKEWAKGGGRVTGQHCSEELEAEVSAGTIGKVSTALVTIASQQLACFKGSFGFKFGAELMDATLDRAWFVWSPFSVLTRAPGRISWSGGPAVQFMAEWSGMANEGLRSLGASLPPPTGIGTFGRSGFVDGQWSGVDAGVGAVEWASNRLPGVTYWFAGFEFQTAGCPAHLTVTSDAWFDGFEFQMARCPAHLIVNSNFEFELCPGWGIIYMQGFLEDMTLVLVGDPMAGFCQVTAVFDG